MDWSNKEVLKNPNLSYTSRDYASIYKELKESIPHLTAMYNPQDEADAGIVLIKTMAMLGDMLSFVSDNNALEAFPQTVIQPLNAQQIFRLVGYKMKWYQSAKCEASFTNANSLPVTIGRYSTFSTADSKIKYTNTSQIEIPAGVSGTSAYKTTLTQGVPITPPLSSTYTLSGEDWHSSYGYNIDVSIDVSNNMIYIPHTNVDGSTIILIDDDSSAFADNTWTLVDNLNTITDIGKYFEFDFTGNVPYIKLPEYWNSRYTITKFKLFYVISNGSNGEIQDNALTTISTENMIIAGAANVKQYLDNLTIFNTASTYGYSPETPEEARKNAELYNNTIDTLVTLSDFTKAAKRIEGVANAIATDKNTDPDAENTLSNKVKIYIARKPGYSQGLSNIFPDPTYTETELTAAEELWKEQVIEELRSYKTVTKDIEVLLDNSIDWIDWTIEGSMWMRQPIPADKNHDILVNINNNLDNTFSASNLNFNEAINYIDVIDRIKASDKLIYHVDLNSAAIQYSRIRRDHNGQSTGQSVETRWLIYDSNKNSYTGYYANGFGCYPAPGGSGEGANSGFRIKQESGNSISYGLDFGTGNDADEYEIYNDKILVWTSEDWKDTGYYVTHDDENMPKILNPEGEVVYYMSESNIILNSEGMPSEFYLVRNNRDARGRSKNNKDYDENTATDVYDIYENIYHSWTGRYIDRATGEIFLVRNNYAYSTNKFYDESSSNIVDGFGSPVLDENGSYIRDAVGKEAVTGRYEQALFPTSEDSLEYDIYLGQDENGEPLKDSVGNIITAFPIKPGSVTIFIDSDKYILHDTGYGNILGTSGILDGPGSIDYATGHIKFKLTTVPNISTKIVYNKNTIAMARYTPFDTNKFYTQPQFLRDSSAKRSLE